MSQGYEAGAAARDLCELRHGLSAAVVLPDSTGRRQLVVTLRRNHQTE